MSSNKATVFVEWETMEGARECLILVQDEDEGLAWFEKAVYEKGERRWKTDVELSSVEKITAANYPQDTIEDLKDE